MNVLVKVYNHWLNKKWSQREYVIKELENLRPDHFNLTEKVAEAEHQIGRFKNMQLLFAEQLADYGELSVLEFGTYKGLGLAMLSLAAGKQKFIRFLGVDCFAGLPQSSTIWRKGQFNDTSIENVTDFLKMFEAKNRRFNLLKSHFSDLSNLEKIYTTIGAPIIVHFDADLGSSTAEALKITERLLDKKLNEAYFLFDDWGCHPDEVPDAFYDWLHRVERGSKITAEKIYSTRYSRYFKMRFEW